MNGGTVITCDGPRLNGTVNTSVRRPGAEILGGRARLNLNLYWYYVARARQAADVFRVRGLAANANNSLFDYEKPPLPVLTARLKKLQGICYMKPSATQWAEKAIKEAGRRERDARDPRSG